MKIGLLSFSQAVKLWCLLIEFVCLGTTVLMCVCFSIDLDLVTWLDGSEGNNGTWRIVKLERLFQSWQGLLVSSAEAVAIVQNNHRVMVVIDILLRILSRVAVTNLLFLQSTFLNLN